MDYNILQLLWIEREVRIWILLLPQCVVVESSIMACVQMSRGASLATVILVLKGTSAHANRRLLQDNDRGLLCFGVTPGRGVSWGQGAVVRHS